ncbi:hypothetical protein B0H11DRAFT_495495 [Mycena galericulata]|nr:hypothetical protein B0H11DRAFT_495495 [Mycena galericulata]
MFMEPPMTHPPLHPTTWNSGGTQLTANHSQIHPTPSFPTLHFITRPQSVEQRYVDPFQMFMEPSTTHSALYPTTWFWRNPADRQPLPHPSRSHISNTISSRANSPWQQAPERHAALPTPYVHGAAYEQFPLPSHYPDLRPTANHSHTHPTPSLQIELPGTRPQNGKKRCANRYREHPERIKDIVERAVEDAAELRDRIECKWWPRCDETVSTEQGALWTHLKNRHGVLHGVRVGCLWTGCSATLKSSSLVQHVKSVHLHWRVLCTSCGESFAREDTEKAPVRRA